MPFCKECNCFNYLMCKHNMVAQPVKAPNDNNLESKLIPGWVSSEITYYYCRSCMQPYRYYEELQLHRRRNKH